jgi:hypothetical protein
MLTWRHVRLRAGNQLDSASRSSYAARPAQATFRAQRPAAVLVRQAATTQARTGGSSCQSVLAAGYRQQAVSVRACASVQWSPRRECDRSRFKVSQVVYMTFCVAWYGMSSCAPVWFWYYGMVCHMVAPCTASSGGKHVPPLVEATFRKAACARSNHVEYECSAM